MASYDGRGGPCTNEIYEFTLLLSAKPLLHPAYIVVDLTNNMADPTPLTWAWLAEVSLMSLQWRSSQWLTEMKKHNLRRSKNTTTPQMAPAPSQHKQHQATSSVLHNASASPVNEADQETWSTAETWSTEHIPWSAAEHFPEQNETVQTRNDSVTKVDEMAASLKKRPLNTVQPVNGEHVQTKEAGSTVNLPKQGEKPWNSGVDKDEDVEMAGMYTCITSSRHLLMHANIYLFFQSKVSLV